MSVKPKRTGNKKSRAVAEADQPASRTRTEDKREMQSKRT